MATSTKIKGIGLSLKIGTPSVDFWADCTTCELDNEEASEDVTTFYDASQPGGARQFFFNLSGVQSTDEESMWTYIWDHAGEEVAFTYAPHGNATASVSQPHFTGLVKIGPRPKIGGEASRTGAYTFDSRWDVTGTPVRVTT